MTARISYATYRYVTATVFVLTAVLLMVTWLFMQAHSRILALQTDNQKMEKENRIMRIENKAFSAIAPDSSRHLNNNAPRDINEAYNQYLLAQRLYEEACKKYNYAWC